MSRETVKVYLAFEVPRDAGRRSGFISQAKQYCDFRIEDLSLPQAVHNGSWQREAGQRIENSDVVIVLLGQDTHNATGVGAEISLAGQWGRPVIQLMPQGQNYGLASRTIPVCRYKWPRINEMMRNPRAFRGN